MTTSEEEQKNFFIKEIYEIELVSVGNFGKISLFLCGNCIPKFKKSEE
ncbi:MAG TPA: hypothetical protein VJ697_00280 [Nitrososphaeraceae archaeon]|nr:hypothetical protein [Nitrososphaeraceae archaeon]